MDLNTLKGQLDSTESQLGQYTANLPSEIETQIQNAYTPALQKSLDTTKTQMSDYLGRYFDATSMGPGMQGSSAIDLSPTQKLGVMGRELGTMSGELQASQRFSDYLGGQMNDMYQKALGAAQMGQQNLADQYARQFQMYQLAWQEAEAEKNRQLQRQLIQRQIDANRYTPPPTVKDKVEEELEIIVQEKPTTKQLLVGSGGGIVNKSTTPQSLSGGVLPNSGGQTYKYDPLKLLGVSGTNKNNFLIR
jgi:hypothetical protein